MALMTRSGGGWVRAHNATITGGVTIGGLASFWLSGVGGGGGAAVRIGARTKVQYGAVVHCDTEVPNTIGADVVIGHGAIVHGARVGDRCLIGMGATLLSNTRLGDDVFIAAGAVVP